MLSFLSKIIRLEIVGNLYLFNLLIIILLICTNLAGAQERKLLTDKPGTFMLNKYALNSHGPDIYLKVCSCTNAESDDALAKLDSLVTVFKENSVLNDIKGFDGICDLKAGNCNSKFGYGIQSWVSFSFRTWSMYNGKIEQWKIEPPQWSFVVNMTEGFCSNGFNVTNYSNDYSPTNPAFNGESANNTAVALHELFFLPGVRESVGPGIDRYGVTLVLFNPERQAYWEQVTLREVFRLLLDYWKMVPDKAGMEAVVSILTNEFNNFSETEKDGYAYINSTESISGIGSAKNEIPVMRPNPHYWNRCLPKSAIQFIVMDIPQKQELEGKMNHCLQNQEGTYFKYWFLYELDVISLAQLIEK
jgi:hypothetical protein